jgi:mRNA-degrading endonuclease toxin of MazEF toxin-antitoxin module
MLTSGDVVEIDLGAPAGRKAGLRHPAVVVTAQRFLDAGAKVI